MRIALILKHYSPRRGGAEYDLRRLSQSLLDRGHEVHLFVNKVEGFPPEGLHFHHVPIWRSSSPIKNGSFALLAPHAIRKSGLSFDVIHAMTQTFPSDLYWNGGGLQLSWLPIRYGSQAWRWVRWNPRHAVNLWVEKKIFQPGNYRRVVTLSHMEDSLLREHYLVPDNLLVCIPNGVDVSRFNTTRREGIREQQRQMLGLQPGQRLLMFSGSDWHRKGLLPLLEALADISPSFQDRLLITGNDDPTLWKTRVEKLGLLDKVLFAGRVDSIESWYQTADLFILPSLFDAYGNVVPEALACGCPVLTTRTVGASELIEEDITGWVIDSSSNKPALIHKLQIALYQADLEQMGRQAAQSVAGLTWDWTVDQLERLYYEIAEDKRRMKLL